MVTQWARSSPWAVPNIPAQSVPQLSKSVELQPPNEGPPGPLGGLAWVILAQQEPQIASQTQSIICSFLRGTAIKSSLSALVTTTGDLLLGEVLVVKQLFFEA